MKLNSMNANRIGICLGHFIDGDGEGGVEEKSAAIVTTSAATFCASAHHP